MSIVRGKSWVNSVTLLSFGGDIDVRYVLADDASYVELAVNSGETVEMTFTGDSLERFTAEANKALAAMRDAG